MSRFQKAVVISIWLYSLLFWAYICIKIVFTTSEVVYFSNLFIDTIPGLTFLNLGISSFLLSFICLIIYLTVWGKPKVA